MMPLKSISDCSIFWGQKLSSSAVPVRAAVVVGNREFQCSGANAPFWDALAAAQAIGGRLARITSAAEAAAVLTLPCFAGDGTGDSGQGFGV